MKKILQITAGVLLSLTTINAQTNNTLVVFSEGGERFYLILNGLRQNDAAATNVKAVGLNQSTYKAKIIFEQKGVPDADKTLYMSWGGAPANNMEFVCSIKKDKKGKYKWSMISTAEISANSPYAYIQPSYPGVTGTTTTVTASDNTQVATNINTSTNTNTNTTGSTNNVNVGVSGNPSNTNTTVTTTTTTAGGTNGVNMGVNMNGTGISINMNITDPLLNGTTQSTTTTTSTTTTYTTGTTTSTITPVVTTTSNTVISTPATTTTTVYTDNTQATNTVNTTATGSCGIEMGSSDFASAKKSIASKSFEDSKLTIAKQIIGTNCMNTNQVKEVMEQFSFEQTKLDWAKYAYKRTTDKNNYFKINDAFTFETSIDELNEYISKVK